MFSFRYYFSLKQSKSQAHEPTPEALIAFFPRWVSFLREDIQRLKKKGIISKKAAIVYDENLCSWQNNPMKNILDPLNLKEIDHLYESLLNFISNDIELNPNRLDIPGGYPFSKDFTGVYVQTHVLLEEGSENMIFDLIRSEESMVGSSKSGQEILENVKRNLNRIPWLKKVPEEFNKIKLPPKPHAETIWFINHSQELINYLQKDKFLSLPPLNDKFPQMQLIQSPRLEVITSSACCEAFCQQLFSALRKYLQKQGIYLPIVLYADASFNNPSEPEGSIYIINSQGEFIDAGIQCNTPNTQQLSLPSRFRATISNQEQKDYSSLTLIGGWAMMELLKLGRREVGTGQVNPMTYIAPDSLIIYAADTILEDPAASHTLKKTVSYLIDTLDNMNPHLLVWWRMAFLEQLHWLLISYEDPRYREAARRDSAATDMALPVVVAPDDRAQQEKFCKAFFRMWEHFDWFRVSSLREVYFNMFHYFTDEPDEKMFLGCMVGPLSVGMIEKMIEGEEDEFVKDAYRHHILRRNRPFIEEVDETVNVNQEDEHLPGNIVISKL